MKLNKKLIIFAFLLISITSIALAGCSNKPSIKQLYSYKRIDFEAQTNLGAIFTDETAFNVINSLYISAGYLSDRGAAVSPDATTQAHNFYKPGIKVSNYVAAAPFKCSGLTNNKTGILETNSGTLVKGGFVNMGFAPMGKLYFYYFVKALPKASTQAPHKLTSIPKFPSNPDVACGNGFEAFAVSNFTGSNLQVYEINDYTSTPILVYGKSY
jgi:hypothetical protein